MTKKPNTLPVHPLNSQDFWDDYEGKLAQLHERWTPHDQQAAILKSIFGQNKKRVFVRAGRKWGKTELAEYIIWRIAALFPESACCFVGPTLKQQKKIIWKNKRLQKFVPETWDMDTKETELTIRLPNDSYIEVDGSDNYEAARGTEYDVIVLDEFKDMDIRYYEAIYPNLAARNGLLVLIGTPPRGANYKDSHYYKVEKEIREDPDWVFFHAPIWANPHISAAWVKKEREKYKKRGDYDIWQSEYEAMYVTGTKGSVFPMFSHVNNVRHNDVLIDIIKSKPKQWHFYTAIDPASTSVFGAILIAYNRHTGNIFVLDEIYLKEQAQMSTAVAWGQIKEKQNRIQQELGFPIARWINIYDEAAAWFANEVMANYREGLIPSRKSKSNKESGLSLMKDLFNLKGAYMISMRCRNHIYEIENYEKDEYGNLPKKHDHTIDAARYFLDIAGVNINIIADLDPVDVEDSREMVAHRNKNGLESLMDVDDDILYSIF